MRHLFAILLLIGSLHAFALGGVWVLEIQYELNGESRHGFVLADYWADDYERFISAGTAFTPEFQNAFMGYDSIAIYDQIIDREVIARTAVFPIHSFELVQESQKLYSPSDIQQVELIKIWRRNDYVINVLTNISLADTAWIGGAADVVYPIGQDVGCRLEVYHFSEKSESTTLLQEFATLYKLESDSLTLKQRERKTQLLEKLKQLQVVIVELCGC